jgi:hypothetical protein
MFDRQKLEIFNRELENAMLAAWYKNPVHSVREL